MLELNDIAKPILRWAGGKSWLLKHLNEILPEKGFNNYHEPFLGGASIFLALNPRFSFLSDLNVELIETYETLRDFPEQVISSLSKHINEEDYYYFLRDFEPPNQIERASKFIFLNQTSYNGIYRVNLKGKYNVPYGHRSKKILEPDKLISVSKRLQAVKFQKGDFSIVLENVKKNDLVFLDPPYTVSHNNNGFIKYNHKLFSLDDQIRLSMVIDEIKIRGAYYILTNAAHERIRDIFDKGDTLLKKSRANLIGGSQAQRGTTEEYIFTNTL
ncbi:Dam family site-specific DNA-(adenine-N6)-methyltransferase [Algoriphagus sp. CAU 1675]|uniref:DNA adenine methylase n=1 Tax=Algoriphagus sp. CAU 1675 TaxID=3032597 RepID=UPI0023DB6021|nr:Dam family site-specific DNA-(adenine-N6)-methyltransferase [Algoriphagus sp. CAU 1675]MDF2156689.1 Dam family site-specific DNA-(adenine-N6)-methyltransferase [Algoriphagus sp. CAU 1675]